MSSVAEKNPLSTMDAKVNVTATVLGASMVTPVHFAGSRARAHCIYGWGQVTQVLTWPSKDNPYAGLTTFGDQIYSILRSNC